MFPSTIYFIVTIFLHPHPLSSALDGSLCDGHYGEEVLCLMRHLPHDLPHMSVIVIASVIRRPDTPFTTVPSHIDPGTDV